MALPIRQLDKFDQEEKNYLERVELYLIVKGVKEERKVAALLDPSVDKVSGSFSQRKN